jgi:hypothetical protein
MRRHYADAHVRTWLKWNGLGWAGCDHWTRHVRYA